MWHDTLTEFARTWVGNDCALQSVSILGKEFPVKSAKELLDAIIKVAALRSPKVLREAIRRSSCKWIWQSKRSPWGFKYANKCNASTAIVRARSVANWAGWPISDVVVSYRKKQLEAEIKASKRIVCASLENGGQWFTFEDDSLSEELIAGSSAVCIEIDGKAYATNSWEDVLLRILDYICDHREGLLLSALKNKNIHPWFSFTSAEMVKPRKHLCGCFVDVGEAPAVLVDRARNILKACRVDMSIVKVIYVPVKKNEGSRAIASPALRQGEELEITRQLIQDIRTNYPNGFDFKETSRRLVGERVGKRFGDAEAGHLKERMFQRADGLWLLSDMVISEDALRRIKERAGGFLSEDGYFSMDALHAEFESEMRNINDGRDFDAFFAKLIAGDVSGIVRGHGEWRVCFAASMSEASGWEAIVGRIREVLKDCGDAVSVEDIIVQMPSLVRGVVVRLAREQMEDAVVFDAGGVEYIKLLESYYLPDDFSEVVSGFIETTEASQNVVSVVLLEAELDGRYGDGFRINYGLEDDSVFKQVVAKSFTGKDHGWNRDMFTLNGRRGESNVAEVFMKGHRDKFHEEDFFRYALESRGMKNRGMLILTFLRKHCIRLSRDWWISTDSFEARFGMGDAQYHQVGIVLNEVVGNNRFVPISSLGEDVYDRFPRLECEGKEYPWNPYLLTSVAVHKVRNAKVVNDEPSPYTVTAMILPHTAEIIGDVVEYVLGTFPKGYFNDVDSAFRYLKMNNVRLTKTEKLVAKIKVILGIL